MPPAYVTVHKKKQKAFKLLNKTFDYLNVGRKASAPFPDSEEFRITSNTPSRKLNFL